MNGPSAVGTLPSFVVIGAMKAGTTSLHSWLGTHPDVFVSEPKELDFFVQSGAWSKGIDWYRAAFSDTGDATALGESSPNYTKTHDDPQIPERMREVIPDVRLIYIVREPISRMRSMYRHLALDGTEMRNFTDAVTQDPDYLETSRYTRHIDAFLDHYPRGQLLVLTTEQLAVDPNRTMDAAFRHIGVDPSRAVRVDRSRNVTRERRQESSLSGALKSFPPYWAALNRSWRIREIHRRLLTSPVSVPEVSLSSTVEADLRGRLEDSTVALERFLGRRLHEWGR